MEILVDRFGWGNCGADEITKVLGTAVLEFANVGISVPETICIYPSEFDYPQVLNKRGPKGEHIILLTARNRSWDSFIYEFSHELCHVFTAHYTTKTNHRNRWIDESICEIASHWCLNKLSVTWKSSPPFTTSGWSEYSDELVEKSNSKLNHITGPEEKDVFKAWFQGQVSSLRVNSIQREKNKIIARQLLPLFETNPSLWKCAQVLNISNINTEVASNIFLDEWRDRSPHPELVQHLIDELY